MIRGVVHDFFTVPCGATMVGDLLRSVADAGFVRRAGLPLRGARLTQALLLPPPSRPLHVRMARLRCGDAGSGIRAFRRRCGATIRPAKWRMPRVATPENRPPSSLAKRTGKKLGDKPGRGIRSKNIRTVVSSVISHLSTFDLRPSTLDLRPSTFDLRPSTFDLGPSSFIFHL